MIPVRPHRRLVTTFVLSLWSSAVGACGSQVAESSTTPTGSGTGAEPASPTLGLPVPDLAIEWEPPSLTGGDLGALAATLRGRRVWVGIGPGAEVTLDDAEPFVSALGATVLGGSALGLSDVIRPEALALERATDEDGPPRYRTPRDAMRRDWRAQPGVDAATGAAAELLLILDEASIDSEAWQALPARVTGSCEPALSALGHGQEQGLAYLEDHLDGVDARLLRAYRSTAQTAVPVLRRRWLQPNQLSAECRASLGSLLDEAECRADRPCSVAPRMSLLGEASVVAPWPPIGSACAPSVAVQVRTELSTMARDAVEDIVTTLDPGWSQLSDRLASLGSVYDALVDLCLPRRRRFGPDDLARIRQQLAEIGRVLGSDPRADAVGRWAPSEGAIAGPDGSDLARLWTFDGQPTGAGRRAVGSARALREFGLERGRCVGASGALPLAAIVIDVAAGEVAYLGAHYPEELSCDELGPRGFSPGA